MEESEKLAAQRKTGKRRSISRNRFSSKGCWSKEAKGATRNRRRRRRREKSRRNYGSEPREEDAERTGPTKMALASIPFGFALDLGAVIAPLTGWYLCSRALVNLRIIS